MRNKTMVKIVDHFDSENLILNESSKVYSPPKFLVAKIEDSWNKFQEKANQIGAEVWNGKIYRIASYNRKDNKTEINLGLTDFKTHHACHDISQELEEISFEDRPNGCYISSYILSADRKLIFSKKGSASTLRTSVNLIGGNLNQDEMQISNVSDLFSFWIKELEEETGFTEDIIKEIKGEGIYIAHSYRIAFLLITKINLTAQQFIDKSNKNHEHEQFIVFDINSAKEKIRLLDGVNPVILFTISEISNELESSLT